jgi:hypothetical protein
MPTKVLKTTADFLGIANGFKGRIVTLHTKTTPKLLKTGNPFDDVRKVAKVQVQIGVDYPTSVENQRARENAQEALPFKSQGMSWGAFVDGIAIIEHKGKLYVRTQVVRSLDYHYETADGEMLDKDSVNAFLPKRKPSATQKVEKERMVRNYKLDSIIGIAQGDELWVMEDNVELVSDIAAIR